MHTARSSLHQVHAPFFVVGVLRSVQKAHFYEVVECGYHILKTKIVLQDESKWEHPEPHRQVDKG